jgi:hypothetical protein
MSENKDSAGNKLQRSKVLTVLNEKGKKFTEYIDSGSPIIETISKYAEFAGDLPFLSVLKVFSKLLDEVTKINDPRQLGYYACKIAFLDALQMALNSDDFNSPIEAKYVIKAVEEQLKAINLSDITFYTFDSDHPTQHRSFESMLENGNARLMTLGFHESQRLALEKEIKEKYSESLRVLFTNRDTAEKFKPFKEYISLEPKHLAAKEKLYQHAEYQVWQFESAPVLGKEPFPLKDVYIESECGRLTWGEIIRENEESSERVVRNELKQPKLDAFNEENGGRHKLLDVVMRLIADEKGKQPIIIQGVAGSGKTSFTLRLCSELVKHGLIPIRIRLRDVNLGWTIEEALPRAIRLSQTLYADKDILLNNDIFKESGFGSFDKISRYVLILDGWDELSTAASDSFKARVEKVIGKILDKFIPNSSARFPVKIILTGRPSEQITTGELLTNDTPVLTLRSLTNPQLTQFVGNIQKAVQTDKIEKFRETFADFPADYFPPESDFSDWKNFDISKFDSILSKYDHKEKRLEVLGLPLLAHLTAHLIKYWQGKDAAALVENETTLYRNLINLTCEKAGKGHIDKTISAGDASKLSTFRGTDLRKLLWAAAGAMSVFGDESISYDELERRLNENEELRGIVERLDKENWLSSLLISFYFKGGVKELGCEFSHKSFREYLFAEAIVRELKDYGKKAEAHYHEHANEWDDFPENDKRRDLSRNLARLLSPQWLKDEVIDFLRDLIEWEIERAKDAAKDQDIGLCEDSSTLEQWRNVRDGLADVWGWWNESVHLRPQAEYKRGRKVYEKPAFVNELLENAMPFSEERDLPPPAVNALDAHLGEAFCYLNVFLHNFLRHKGEENKNCRRHQSIFQNEKRFKPSADKKRIYTDKFADFYYAVGRINGIGDRPRNVFPVKMDLTAIDLSSCYLDGLVFASARLDNARLNNAILDNARLNNASLDYASLDYAILINAILINASLDHASLDYASLDYASFVNARLKGADLRFATNLTKEQIASAWIDEKTQLPEHLEPFRAEFLRHSYQRQGIDIEDIDDDIDDEDLDEAAETEND